MQVIINTAGMGRRLGLNISKALVDIAGKPLICHQIDALRSIFPTTPIIVVIGYMAKEVAIAVGERANVHMVFNPYYESEGVVTSIAMAVRSSHFNPSDTTLRIDGDLFFTDMEKIRVMCESKQSCVGIQEKVEAGQTVVVKTNGNACVGLFYTTNYRGDYEWPCVDFYTPHTLQEMMQYRQQFQQSAYYQLLNFFIDQLTIDSKPPIATFLLSGVMEVDDERDLERVRNTVRLSPSILDYSQPLSTLSEHSGKTPD